MNKTLDAMSEMLNKDNAPLVMIGVVCFAIGWLISELTKGSKARRTGQVWPPPAAHVGRHRPTQTTGTVTHKQVVVIDGFTPHMQSILRSIEKERQDADA